MFLAAAIAAVRYMLIVVAAWLDATVEKIRFGLLEIGINLQLILVELMLVGGLWRWVVVMRWATEKSAPSTQESGKG